MQTLTADRRRVQRLWVGAGSETTVYWKEFGEKVLGKWEDSWGRVERMDKSFGVAVVAVM